MKVRLKASTGEKIVVWRDQDVLHSRRADAADRAQICLAVDLFEVIAELAGLDLEQPEQAAEAVTLADHAQQQLGVRRRRARGDTDQPPGPDGTG